MKKTLTRLTAAVALACAATLPAQAHNAWLLPSTTVLSKADWITVDAAVSNDLFFFNHVPLNVQGLQITAPDGSALQPQTHTRASCATCLTCTCSSLAPTASPR